MFPNSVWVFNTIRTSYWFPFEEQQQVDVFEILLDNLMAPLDGPMLMQPGKAELIQRLRSRCVLLAHSNYGGEFGFGPLEETPAVRRHVSLERMLESPWVSDHCFYAEDSWMDIWSSPLQFSRAEVTRIAARARRLQEFYGMPLGHENTAYYVACPGAEMSEAEFSGPARRGLGHLAPLGSAQRLHQLHQPLRVQCRRFPADDST